MSLRDCFNLKSCTDKVGPVGDPDSLAGVVARGTGCYPIRAPGCGPAQFTDRSKTAAYSAFLVSEALNRAGADVLVYRMLGVHEQNRMVDATGNGSAISGGDISGFPADRAFDGGPSEWRSSQRGSAVLESSFIGYDFGEIRTAKKHPVYSVEAGIRKDVGAVSIKQSVDPTKRVSSVRLERSENGTLWRGVEVFDLPDNDCVITLYVSRATAPSRYWRLRPTGFSGGSSDYWAVSQVSFYANFKATAIGNIQDPIFLENRDRDYSTIPVLLKGRYDVQDSQAELTALAIGSFSDTYTIQLSFASVVQQIGRPLVIGDLINLPGETQYSATMSPVLKWLEVTDVSWDSQGYAIDWKPTMLRVIASPAQATQETQDIFGNLAPTADSMGSLDKDDGNSPEWQDYANISQTILALSKDAAPERGTTVSSKFTKFSDDELKRAQEADIPVWKLSRVSTGPYVEDAFPPNDLPYTEGDGYPPNPVDGDYHRLTYTHLLPDIYPARLYRYSSKKRRWLLMEIDRRAQLDPTKPIEKSEIRSGSRIDAAMITDERPRADDY